MPSFYDVIIIGGGVVGCMAARFLSKYDLKILLVEKESDVGMGASSANSAIIHAGHDPLPGSLKARMNTRANPMWDQLSAELSVPFERRGSYVVAGTADEFSRLEALLQRSRQNGIPGVEIILRDEMLRREPALAPTITGALFTPTAGLVDTLLISLAAAENAVQNGVTVLLETAFSGFIFEGRRIVGIHTSRGDFSCRWVINAAGLFSDDVMHMAGVRPEFRITPRRGEYCVLDSAECQLKNVLFPVPSAVSKGILVLASLHGNTLVGPDSQSIAEKENEDITPQGMDEIWQGAYRLVPSLSPRHTIATFAGLRATGNASSEDASLDYHHDFIVEIPAGVQGLVNTGGIESPGLTAAPAIAERILELLRDAGEPLREKAGWNPVRPGRPRFHALSRKEQAELVARDPRYARVICRCELVTEGEIVAEIHGPIPALTYDAIKRRTWLGTGRCLGSFDMPRVIQILAQETGRSPLEISKRGPGSEFLVRETKQVEG